MLLIPVDPKQPFELLIALIRPESGALKVQGRSAVTDAALTPWLPITVLESEPERRELDLRNSAALEIELELALRGAAGTYVEITLQINQRGHRVWEQVITGMTDGEGNYSDQRSLRVGDAAGTEQGPPTQSEAREDAPPAPSSGSTDAAESLAPPWGTPVKRSKGPTRGGGVAPGTRSTRGGGPARGGAPAGGAARSRKMERAAESPAMPAAAPSSAARAGEYVVWFGTNRKPGAVSDGVQQFTGQRDTRVHYGRCAITVPASHKIGSIGSPWWKRLITRTDDRLRIDTTDLLDAATHWAEVGKALARLEAGLRHAVVMVHGYNVAFDEAARRAAQIGYDLGIEGAMAFFSWPSQGTLKGYTGDEATIEASEGPIADYLADFATRSGADQVHVIAHSMGNRGLLRAMNRIIADAERRASVRFGQFILAAPDVDVDVFRDLCKAYADVCKRTTLYVSARDRAVAASEFLHGAPRVGFAPPVTVLPEIDTINVTNVDVTLLGHGYVADARDILHDMHDLIFNGSPPERRLGLHAVQTADGGKYWEIGS